VTWPQHFCWRGRHVSAGVDNRWWHGPWQGCWRGMLMWIFFNHGLFINGSILEVGHIVTQNFSPFKYSWHHFGPVTFQPITISTQIILNATTNLPELSLQIRYNVFTSKIIETTNYQITFMFHLWFPKQLRISYWWCIPKQVALEIIISSESVSKCSCKENKHDNLQVERHNSKI
jgi:hypothetical protein